MLTSAIRCLKLRESEARTESFVLVMGRGVEGLPNRRPPATSEKQMHSSQSSQLLKGRHDRSSLYYSRIQREHHRPDIERRGHNCEPVRNKIFAALCRRSPKAVRQVLSHFFACEVGKYLGTDHPNEKSDIEDGANSRRNSRLHGHVSETSKAVLGFETVQITTLSYLPQREPRDCKISSFQEI